MGISDWSSDVGSSDLLASARPVVTFVERDMSYPSAEGAIPIIAIERREAGDDGFLRQVHRLVGIADLPHDEPINARFVTAQKFAIRILAVCASEDRQVLVATLR